MNEITDGAQSAVKVARSVLTGGKAGDCIKGLPIGIGDLQIRRQHRDGRKRRGLCVAEGRERTGEWLHLRL